MFGQANSGLWRISAAGGEPEPLTTVEPGEQHARPQVLPGGDAVLFHIFRGDLESVEIAVLSLETGEQKTLLGGSTPRYAATGHLVFGRQDSLWAAPFDLAQLAVTGPAVPLLGDIEVSTTTGATQFALARDGSLSYAPAQRGPSGGRRLLVWVEAADCWYGWTGRGTRRRWPPRRVCTISRD